MQAYPDHNLKKRIHVKHDLVEATEDSRSIGAVDIGVLRNRLKYSCTCSKRLKTRSHIFRREIKTLKNEIKILV